MNVKRKTTKRKSKARQKKKFSFVTIIQKIYLSLVFFFINDMWSYASACAFGFLFSFIPVVMLVLIILIRFFHATPEVIDSLFGDSGLMASFLNLDSVANTISGIHSVTNFEIIIGITIIWMARRFFSSVVGSINRIFHTQVPFRPLLSQVVIIAAEAGMVIVSSLIIILNVAFKTLIKLDIFQSLSSMFPVLLGTVTERMVIYLPYIIIFVVVFICYKASSRSNPPTWTCLWCAAACTGGFFVIQKLMGIFLNVNRYNMIYGVLSNIIVLLLEVFFFFVIFLSFAEFVFVSQYFDTLLLSEIYRLPDRDKTGLISTFRRLLFIRPDHLLNSDENVMHFRKGEEIYSNGEDGKFMYYIVSGTVMLLKKNNIAFVDSGSFFGEEAILMDGIRKEDAVAHTDLKLIRINESKFYSILQKNPKVASKAMAKISRYFAWSVNA
ncbi:MAG: YihY/virulence factor BrkB family protein [Treponema sp.]|nr:YihY/virulence factor BrkB family protein [Treponema sp.]